MRNKYWEKVLISEKKMKLRYISKDGKPVKEISFLLTIHEPEGKREIIITIPETLEKRFLEWARENRIKIK